jgi:hypothetical protein
VWSANDRNDRRLLRWERGRVRDVAGVLPVQDAGVDGERQDARHAAEMTNSAAKLCTCRRSASRSLAEDPLVSHLSVILCRGRRSPKGTGRIAVERSTTASGATPAGNACRTQQESSFISRKFNTMFTMSYTGWIRLLRMNQMLQGQLRL